MKKTASIILSLLLTVFVLVSFKSITEKHYGGSANVSVVVYDAIYLPEGTKKGKKSNEFKLDSTVNCSYDDIASAKSALKNDLENQMLSKQGTGKIAEFSTTINYDINSCEN